MAWEVSIMTGRLHHRYLNSYLSLYFHNEHRQILQQTKIVGKHKNVSVVLFRTKTKLIGAMA